MTKPFRELCKSAATAQELRQVVAALDPLSFSPSNIAIINRAAQRIGVPATVRIAYAGTHTMEPLPSCFRAHAVALGMGVTDYVAPYGQYMQLLLPERSELKEFNPDVVFLSCALRQIAPRIHNEFGSLSIGEINSERERIIEHLADAAELASQSLSASILLGNFPRPEFPALGIADSKSQLGEMEFYSTLNLKLLHRFKDSDRIHVVDLDRLVGGARTSSAERMFFIAKSLWTDSQCNFIAQELLRYVVAATGQTRKCLVVDLDNTLWGGVVGEDGADGIMVGAGSPAAEAFESFQHAVRSLRTRGVILAICSKNNPSDVEEVFLRRTNMPLKWSDFSAREIGWEDKGSGVMNLAATLNIGQESLVFADDNPAERAIVRGSAAGVEILELPEDPAEYARLLRRQVWFDKFRIGADDEARLEHYALEHRREQLRIKSGDLNTYLSGLGTEVRVRRARQSDLARVHELLNKTNQFNLTTRRYTLGEMEGFIKNQDFIVEIANASDNFGEMGTIGVYLIELKQGGARLDSFLMSCRALGRNIETAVMNCLKTEILEYAGCRFIDAEFIPTKRNNPAREFLSNQGFELVERYADLSEAYRLHGSSFTTIPCPHLKVLHEIDKDSATA